MEAEGGETEKEREGVRFEDATLMVLKVKKGSMNKPRCAGDL